MTVNPKKDATSGVFFLQSFTVNHNTTVIVDRVMLLGLPLRLLQLRLWGSKC